MTFCSFSTEILFRLLADCFTFLVPHKHPHSRKFLLTIFTFNYKVLQSSKYCKWVPDVPSREILVAFGCKILCHSHYMAIWLLLVCVILGLNSLKIITHKSHIFPDSFTFDFTCLSRLNGFWNASLQFEHFIFSPWGLSWKNYMWRSKFCFLLKVFLHTSQINSSF